MTTPAPKPDTLSPTEAFRGLGGLGALMVPVDPSTRRMRSYCRIPKGADKDDRNRRVIRFGGEERPWSAEELALAVSKGDLIALWPRTLGMVVVDFDTGTDASMQGWIRAMGDPVCVLRSQGGKGYHAWFRLPDEIAPKEQKEVRVDLPGLGGSAERVEADLIGDQYKADIRGADQVVRLAEALGNEGGLMDSLTYRMLRDCVQGKPGRVGAAFNEVATLTEHNRHVPGMKWVGIAWGGVWAGAPADSFLGRGLLAVADHWPGDSKQSLRGQIDYVVRSRKEKADTLFKGMKARKEAAGDPRPVDIRVVERQVGGEFDTDSNGLCAILEGEQWRLGENRRGEKGMVIDFGDGKGWQDLAGRNLRYVRGHLRDTYRKPGGDDTPKRWFMGIDETNVLFTKVAAGTQVDPFLEYLEALPCVEWDAKAEERLMGLPGRLWTFRTDPELVGLAFRFTMCGAVARCYEPGCKHDTMMVLQSGRQGRGKSTFVEKMVPPEIDGLWAVCNLATLGEQGGHKALVEKLHGKVFAEVGEMKSLGGALIEDVKAFITAKADQVRFAYDSRAVRMPRDVVFVGTANRHDPLYADPSGNRRFHMVGISGWADDWMATNMQGVEDRLDDGLRSEWWTLAKACWKALGHRSHRPSPEEEERFGAEAGDYELHTRVHDDVEGLVNGLRLNDDPESFVVSFIPSSKLTDILELSEGPKRPTTLEDRTLANAMGRLGWQKARKPLFFADNPDRDRKRMVFWPIEQGYPSPPPVWDDADLDHWLKRAKDYGTPVTNADIEAWEAKKTRQGGGRA